MNLGNRNTHTNKVDMDRLMTMAKNLIHSSTQMLAEVNLECKT